MVKEQFKIELKNNFDHKMIYLFYVIVNEQTGFEMTLYHRYASCNGVRFG